MPIDDGEPDDGEFAEYIEVLADPERPIQSKEVIAGLLGDRFPRRKTSTWVKLAQVRSPSSRSRSPGNSRRSSNIASPEQIGPMLQALAAEPWAPLLVIGVYIVGGLIAFPVLILIAATAAAFGPRARASPMRRPARSRARSSLMRSASRSAAIRCAR